MKRILLIITMLLFISACTTGSLGRALYKINNPGADSRMIHCNTFCGTPEICTTTCY